MSKSIRKKRLAKKRCRETKRVNKEMRREAKKEVEGQEQCTKEGERTLYRLADRDTKRERTYNRSE